METRKPGASESERPDRGKILVPTASGSVGYAGREVAGMSETDCVYCGDAAWQGFRIHKSLHQGNRTLWFCSVECFTKYATLEAVPDSWRKCIDEGELL